MTVNQVFSAFSFISFVLVSIPFAWHLEAWNTGTCLYMFWVSLSNLVFFINSIIWNGNVVNWSPVWCDISSRIIQASNVAIPATALCIQRRLYHVISNPVGISTRAERRRFIIIDMVIGLFLPILHIALAYIVQGNRYNIFEDFGCQLPLVDTALTVVLIPAWPLAIGIVSAVYGCLNIYNFWTKRKNVRSLLRSSTGGITFSRYIRLLMLSGIDFLCTIPLAVWALSTWLPVAPWPGWTAVHSNFSHVHQIPAAQWRSNHLSLHALELTRWNSVICAIVFFMFFGLADEAMRHYIFALHFIGKIFGYSLFTTHIQMASGSSGSRASEGHNLRPMGSMHTHSVVLPVFSEDRSPISDKPNPFDTSYGKSFLTLPTDFDSDLKHESEHSSPSGLEKLSPSSPITPQLRVSRAPPPLMSYDSGSTRLGSQQSVSETPVGAYAL